MVLLVNSQRIAHAPASANAAIVEHGVGAMESGADVAAGEVEAVNATGLLFNVQVSLITSKGNLFVLILYFCMIPTVCDHLWCHGLPCLLHHEHNLKEVNLVDVIFTSIIKLDCVKTEGSPIVCLDTLNDPSIEGLDI